MAGSRSTPPLYELLSDSERSSPASRDTPEPNSPLPIKPKVIVKPTPLVPTTSTSTNTDPSPEPEPDQTRVQDRSITVTPSTIMLGIAAFLILFLFIWIAGSNFGASKKDQEWSDAVGGTGTQTPLKDPLSDPATSGTMAIPNENPSTTQNQSRPEQTQANRPAKPSASADPRKAGLNYLHLVTLGKQDAAAAVAFLASNGVQATAAIDPASSTSNNRARYKVFALVGITGAQYKNNDPAKRLHEQEIREIGARWLSQGGASNFSQPLWTKFQG